SCCMTPPRRRTRSETWAMRILSPSRHPRDPHSFPTRRSSDLRRHHHLGVSWNCVAADSQSEARARVDHLPLLLPVRQGTRLMRRSEEHTSELQSQSNLVCRLLLEKKKETSALSHGEPQEVPAG